MHTQYQDLVTDERHKAARVEFVLFAFSRLVIFFFVTTAMGWGLYSVLAFLLLAIQRVFAV